VETVETDAGPLQLVGAAVQRVLVGHADDNQMGVLGVRAEETASSLDAGVGRLDYLLGV
jgi:hypothetical protein